MSLNLDTLLADYNGSAMAVAGHAEWGFVGQEWFIAIPRGSTVPDESSIGTSQFGGNFNLKNFLKANYHHVRNVAGTPEIAMFVALYRAHLVTSGVLARVLSKRSVIEDEYITVDPQNGNWDDPANNIPALNGSAAKDIAKFIKHHANTLVHQMVYVFSARGHHWDPKYNDLYERLKAACFIQNVGSFTMPNNEILYRLAIHGFGIKPLADLTEYHKSRSEMAAAMFIRFNPSSPIAGTAHITTLKATLNNMQQEAWYDAFDNKFHDEIVTINKEVDLIHRDQYQYHVAAKVFGHDNRKAVSKEASDAFNVLCQFALGYIDHLGRKHSLYGQEAITKKSGGPRGVADAFSKVCDKFGKPDTSVADMAAFLNSI